MQNNCGRLPCLSSGSFFKPSLPFHIESRPHRYGDVLNMHIHEFIEIGYVASGYGFHITPNSVVNINKGDVFIIKKGIPHQIAVPEGASEPLCLYNCMFSSELLAEYGDILKQEFLRGIMENIVGDDGGVPSCGLIFTDNNNFTIGECLSRLLCEYNARPYGYAQVIPILMLELLAELNRLYARRAKEKTNNYKYNIVQRAMNFISENFDKKLAIGEIAAQAYLSPSQFSRIFKLSAGMTVSEYIRQTRVESMERLIRQGLSINEAAERCGYKNYSTFFRAYKKLTGQPPRRMLDTASGGK